MDRRSSVAPDDWAKKERKRRGLSDPAVEFAFVLPENILRQNQGEKSIPRWQKENT